MITRILFLLGLIVAMPVLAAEEGAKLDRQLCSICHGPGGTTSSELFPQLAGQPAPYLINQLKGFRDKSRADQNAKRFMWGVSSRLTDEDIQHLASFYEQQPPLHGTVTNTAESQLGARIFTQGMADKGVPPCMSCHGERGEGLGEIPRLAGQHETYLKRQLKVFYGNDRPAATAMHEVVKGLSDADIQAIAQYLQAQ